MSTQNVQRIRTQGERKGPRLRRPPRRPGGQLKPERVQEELKTMPGWRALSRARGLCRSRRFNQPLAAAKFAAWVAELASAEGHAVTLGVRGCHVSLVLQRPSRNGISLALLDFARQLG
jgi:pterin-4a-carbinolamine dehydratase